MNPCQLNALIAAITNHLYCELSEDDFVCLGLFLNEMSKSMLSMAVLGDVCGGRKKKRRKEEKPPKRPDKPQKESRAN